MRIERKSSPGLEVVGDSGGAAVAYGARRLDLDGDELRWLQIVALPTVLAVPSDRPATVQDDNGQIEGQLQIGESDGDD